MLEGDPVTGQGPEFAYSATAVNAHYVIETAFPLAALGLSPGDTFSVNWTMGCGNDFVGLENAKVHTPEPASLLIFGSGIITLAGLIRKKKKT